MNGAKYATSVHTNTERVRSFFFCPSAIPLDASQMWNTERLSVSVGHFCIKLDLVFHLWFLKHEFRRKIIIIKKNEKRRRKKRRQSCKHFSTRSRFQHKCQWCFVGSFRPPFSCLFHSSSFFKHINKHIIDSVSWKYTDW